MEGSKPGISANGGATATLYHVAFRNQISLVQIADNKANMIIIMNTLIISTIIAVSGYGMLTDRFVQDKTNILVPITIILLSCLTSALFAIQAAKPKLIAPKTLDLEKPKTSLLFFGSISGYTQQEYLQRMNALITSDQDVYETMNIDLHNQGLILNRKYELLNRAYRIFMFGFIFSVWIFLAFMAMA
jgi:hypothetical protein